MLGELDVRGDMSLLDRRRFMKCALASGAALGVSEVARPASGIPAGAGQQKQDESQMASLARAGTSKCDISYSIFCGSKHTLHSCPNVS